MRLKEADQLNEYERRNHLLDTKEYLKEAERLLHGYCRECLIWDIETLLSELDEEIATKPLKKTSDITRRGPKSKWKDVETTTIRIPKVIKERVLTEARRIFEEEYAI